MFDFFLSKKNMFSEKSEKVKILRFAGNLKIFDVFQIFQKKNVRQKNFDFFFDREKKYFFSELRKKIGYSFDAELSELSIYEVFKAIRAL